MIATEKMFFYTALKRRGHGTPWGSHVEAKGQFGGRRSKGKIQAKSFLLFSQKRMSKAE